MPSPFPGMDPYLENPRRWRNLHQHLITEIYIALNTSLPSDYFASMDERVYVTESNRDIFPDVTVLERRGKQQETHGGIADYLGINSGVAAVLDPPLLLRLQQEEEREVFVEVRRREGDDSEVVTSIEVLSPKNKAAGAGSEAYLRKQHEIFASGIHLLEIDLIRAGKSPLLPPREQISRGIDFNYDYAVSLHRANAGEEFAVWLRTVREPLPRSVFVPLAPSDDDVLLNLQEIFDRCYDIGRNAVNINYNIPPEPPLNADDTAWADTLLHEKGFR